MTTPVASTPTPEEAQSFFERIATTLVAHSQQVRELSEIRYTLSELSNRVDRLSTENNNLRMDLSRAWEAYETCKQERDHAQAEAKIMANDAMDARTETVNVRQEFEQKLGIANDTIDARDTRIRELEDELRSAEQSRGSWLERSNRWEGMAKDSEDKLSKVMIEFNSLAQRVRSLFEPKVESVPEQPTAKSWNDQPEFGLKPAANW